MANIIISESSGRLDALYGKYMAPIASVIEDRVEAWKVKEIGTKIFKERASTNWAEGYVGLTAMEDWLPVGENGAHPTAGFEQGYDKTIKNITWKQTFAVSREMRDDNKIGDMLQRATKMTDSYYRTRERFLARMLGEASQGNNTFKLGGQSFDTTSADGSNLFAVDHAPKVKGGVQSNMYSDEFSVEVLAEIMTKMQNFKGDSGETLGLNPDTLIIPNVASLKQAAFAAIGSNQVPGSGNNDYNYLFGNLNVIVWPYLNDFMGEENTAPFFVMDSTFNDSADGAILQNRVGLEIRNRLGTNDEMIYDGYSRFGAGFVDWRFIIGGGLTGGSTL